MHDALFYARLFIGESLTMVSECAMLGTPAIHVNTMTAGTLAEQEKYGLIFRFFSSEGLVEKAMDLLKMPGLNKEWDSRKNNMLKEKIDLTGFLVWLFEDFPGNLDKIRDKPQLQEMFNLG